MLVDLAVAPSISLGPEFRQLALLQWRLVRIPGFLLTPSFVLIKLRKRCAFQLGDTS